VQDCIGRGKTIKEGGAIYDMISGCQVGVPNVGNSLYAIKKLCFDEKKITLSDLKKALDNDFDGVEGQKIRQILLNHAEKYGNDIDEVDNLTKEAYDIFIKDIVKYKNTRYGRGPKGGIFMPATVTISANVPCGKACGASADGRKANQPTADGVSPMHGTEKFGPTAVFNSVSKLSTLLTTGGQLLNMRFQPNILKNDSDTNKFIALIKTFFSKMGWHVQFNIISTDVLKKAQENPEEYRDLVVRVAGYSALFTALDPIQQQDIISRSEYYL
jgi:formate C-acetyltransferase